MKILFLQRGSKGINYHKKSLNLRLVLNWDLFFHQRLDGDADDKRDEKPQQLFWQRNQVNVKHVFDRLVDPFHNGINVIS